MKDIIRRWLGIDGLERHLFYTQCTLDNTNLILERLEALEPPAEANKRLKVVQSYMVVDTISGASWSSDSWTRADAEAEAERLEKIWGRSSNG